MPKSSVLALVATLGSSQGDALTIDRYYREVVFELARHRWIITASLIPPVPGTAVYNFPAGTVDLIRCFYDAHMLVEAKIDELNWINPQWRDERGAPIAYVYEGETTKTFRAYPIPDVAPSTYAFIFGEDFGRGYPDGTLAVIQSETRDDLPAYLDLPIALAVCAREFERDSNHQDQVFAKACNDLSLVLFGLAKPPGAI